MKRSILIPLLCCIIASHAVVARYLEVALPLLIENPEKFNEKVVSTIGYYAAEHHGVYLCADEETARKGAAGAWQIHLDFEHTSLSPQALATVRHGYVKVTGTFQYRNMKVSTAKDGSRVIAAGFGWMNALDKQITGIVRFENVPPPKSQGSG